jgi:hypothetical protein
VSQDARHSDLNPDSPPVSVTVGDEKSATSSSTCSQCVARLATGGQRDDETQGHGGTADSSGTGTSDSDNDCCLLAYTFPYHCFLWAGFQIRLCIYYRLETRSISRRRRFENERGIGESRSRSSKTDRRFRRLEKTVESLSHGLILALTQLKSGDMHADTGSHRCGPGPSSHHRPGQSDVANDEIESVSGDNSADNNDRDLSTAFGRLGFMEDCMETFIFMLVAFDY